MVTKQIKILAIDDKYDNLVVLKALLEEAFPFATLFTAQSGKEGIELSQIHKPDVVLLDIVMPVMDGYEVCKKLKNNELLKCIPILMITAVRTDKQSRIKALEVGADGFLTKPLDNSEFKAQIRAMLRIKESEDRKMDEKERLEKLVKDRTEALEKELSERRKAEKELQASYIKLEKRKQEVLNLNKNLGNEIEVRKRVEKSQNEANKKYTDAQRIAHIGSWEENLHTRESQWSDEMYHIFGIFPGTPIFWDEIKHCLPPDDMVRLDQAVQTALKECKQYNVDYQIIRPDGGVRYIHDECEVIRDATDKAIRIVGTSHDITDRKLTELELKQSYEFTNSLLKTIPFGMDIVDEEGNVLFQNEIFKEYFGKDGLGKKCWELCRDDKTQCTDCPLKKGIEVGEISVSESPGISGGRTFEISHTGMAFKGKKVILEIFQDVTQRKRDELIQKVLYAISHAVNTTKDVEELSKFIKEQLGQLIDTTNFCIASYDEETDMLISQYFTDQKDSITSWPAKKSLTGYVIKNNKSLVVTKEQILRMSQRGDIEQVGSDCEVWLGVPLLEKGKVIGAFVLQNYEDVNAYTAKDVELLEFISHQISISVQRKKGMQDLMKALAKAEESDHLKTAFLSNMSHEIRTPMNAILGFSELLDDEMLSGEERRRYLDIINTNCHHLLSIINDILDIARIDSNQLSINRMPFNIHLLLDELLVSYDKSKITINKENISFIIEKEYKDNIFTIISDEVRLRQILYNLLGNALKFTKTGFIKFGYKQLDGKLQFFVQDTGKGISIGNQSLVFERFRQEEESYTRQFGGTGLGLSISKKLVELLGGEMWLVSEQEVGTTFFFTLPHTILPEKNK